LVGAETECGVVKDRAADLGSERAISAFRWGKGPERAGVLERAWEPLRRIGRWPKLGGLRVSMSSLTTRAEALLNAVREDLFHRRVSKQALLFEQFGPIDN
jgi:hypothetical protein